jgi:hypothetical protein
VAATRSSSTTRHPVRHHSGSLRPARKAERRLHRAAGSSSRQKCNNGCVPSHWTADEDPNCLLLSSLFLQFAWLEPVKAQSPHAQRDLRFILSMCTHDSNTLKESLIQVLSLSHSPQLGRPFRYIAEAYRMGTLRKNSSGGHPPTTPDPVCVPGSSKGSTDSTQYDLHGVSTRESTRG